MGLVVFFVLSAIVFNASFLFTPSALRSIQVNLTRCALIVAAPVW